MAAVQDAPGWVLVLGSSSGFGAAIAKAFAEAGYDVLGVHLDRRGGQPRVDALQAELRSTGRQIHFFNANAADDDARAGTMASIAEIVRASGRGIRVLVHSLAFGTLRELVAVDGSGIRRTQLEMTVDVMANSLVYWVQDLVREKLWADSGRIYAMTSSGSATVWRSYGPVSAAKAALESHVRQLAMELAPLRITVNAIMAGVTHTPALDKIPDSEGLMQRAIRKNPHHRLTEARDVALCMVDLARPGTYWMTGNVLQVDGGEDICA